MVNSGCVIVLDYLFVGINHNLLINLFSPLISFFGVKRLKTYFRAVSECNYA